MTIQQTLEMRKTLRKEAENKWFTQVLHLKRQPTIEENAGKTYQECYFELNDLINKLNEEIGVKISSTEQDFLASYKGHMEIVAKEMSKYKQMNNERLFNLRKDETITKLQAECGYFKEEALELKTSLEEQKKKVQEYKAELLEVTVENESLKKAIHVLKKQQVEMTRANEEMKK